MSHKTHFNKFLKVSLPWIYLGTGKSKAKYEIQFDTEQRKSDDNDDNGGDMGGGWVTKGPLLRMATCRCALFLQKVE